MIYLFYSTDEYLIKQAIKKVIDDNKIDSININYYNLNTDKINLMIDDASMASLFAPKKLIICENSYLFTGKVGDIEQNTDLLETYLNNPNPDTIIIFTIIYDKLDERKKIVKLIKNIATVKPLLKVNNLNEIVKDMLNGYELEYGVINELTSIVGDNLSILAKETEKLMMYKYDEKVITKKDVIDIASKNIDIDIFAFIDHIINHNMDKALEMYHDLLLINEEPIKIIVILANQFRLMYQVKEMTIKGYTESDIASALAIHPYRVKLAKEKARAYDNAKLLSYLNALADLDYNVKTGKVNNELGLELFIMSI